MSNFPKRDITGHCEGECRNRVREAYEEHQSKISSQRGDNDHESGHSSPEWTRSRNAPPGWLGGPV